MSVSSTSLPWKNRLEWDGEEEKYEKERREERKGGRGVIKVSVSMNECKRL